MKWLWAILALVIMIQPVTHKDLYMVMNNDTTAHLSVFNSIEKGDMPRFLYLGQQITGYSLVWIDNIVHVGIPTLFMWFSYIMLLLSGLSVGSLVTMVSKNQLSGILSGGLIIFGVPPTLHLFYSGTIFDIIEILVLVPIILIVVYKIIEKKQLYLCAVLPILVIFTYLYHPSFSKDFISVNQNLPYENILNPLSVINTLFGAGMVGLLAISLAILYKAEPNITLGAKIILGLVISLMAGMLMLSFIGITNFSSRLAFNGGLMFGILICLLIGMVLSYSKSKWISGIIVSYVVISIMPNLVHWLSFPIIAK